MSAGSAETRWFAVLNPISGRGAAARDRASIESAWRSHGLELQIAVSEYAGHALPLIAQALDAGARRIVAIGGDGTMQEAVNAIRQHGSADDVILAPMPVGTGNDWCRSLATPRDYRTVAAWCAAGKTRRVDIGFAEFADGDGSRHFVNVAGAGFDAYVIEQMPDRRFGVLAYLFAVLKGLAAYRPVAMRVRAESDTLDGRMFVAFACNGAYCGGGMHVAPPADLRDGLFDIVVIGDLGRLDVLASLRRLFDGTIAAHPRVKTLRAASLTIDGPERLAVEADGELVGHTPVTLRVLPRALTVIAP